MEINVSITCYETIMNRRGLGLPLALFKVGDWPQTLFLSQGISNIPYLLLYLLILFPPIEQIVLKVVRGSMVFITCFPDCISFSLYEVSFEGKAYSHGSRGSVSVLFSTALSSMMRAL